MKKLLLNTVTILSLAILSSCSKESSTPLPITKSSIIGKWKKIKTVEEGNEKTLSNCSKNAVYDYNENDTLYTTYPAEHCGVLSTNKVKYVISEQNGQGTIFTYGTENIKFLNANSFELSDNDEVETYQRQ